MVGSVLSIKPVLTIQGENWIHLQKSVESGNMKKYEQRMMEAMRADIQNRFSDVPEEHLHIGTVGAGLSPECKNEWMERLQKHFLKRMYIITLFQQALQRISVREPLVWV